MVDHGLPWQTMVYPMDELGVDQPKVSRNHSQDIGRASEKVRWSRKNLNKIPSLVT